MTILRAKVIIVVLMTSASTNSETPLRYQPSPTPRPALPETNLELFNNNIPKNCTVAYKQVTVNRTMRKQSHSEISGNVTVNSMDNSGNLNTSLDLGQLAVSEHFSAEMNAWYKDQQKNNNNSTGSARKVGRQPL
ncbi:hypothetical protein NQ318_003542 [Aromia moschata]|uniref:Uncharacterized protein n=1 Tax=Aromia moschata TaxID=1265417 RepID=A0AAV8YWQ7_9CUCU|nr:hypothetical protein NQ318_003542 [Aromia moschata]